MAKDPAFLFYTGDFSTGTQFFTDEQLGKYMRLLMAQHQHGHLSEEQVIFICKSYDNVVMKKFVKDNNGLYYNVRLEVEILKRKNYTESRGKNKLGKSKTNKKAPKSYDSHMEDENKDKDKDTNMPSFELFNDYCKENGFSGIAKKAFDWYDGNKWMVGKRKISNWKNQLRTNWFDEKNKDKSESNKLVKCIRQDHMGRMEVELTMAKIEQLRANGTFITIL